MTAHSSDDRSIRLTLRKRVDEICTLYERAWQSGSCPRIEEYLASSDSEARSALFVELLRLEKYYRGRAGEQPSLDEYRQRFPEYSELIHSTVHESAGSSKVHQACPYPRAEFAIGDHLDEFEILEELGRGAFGTVYRAYQHGVEREVALKVTALETHEARTMAPLDGHPNIVRIFDQRTLEDEGLHVLYMEFVPGVTLRSIIRRVHQESTGFRNRQSLDRIITACRVSPRAETAVETCASADARDVAGSDGGFRDSWVTQVCHLFSRLADALAFAHRRGVLHCDIKPANILLDSDGTPKLVDFNIAHHRSLQHVPLGGTFEYMSPEQLDACEEPNEQARARKAANLTGSIDVYSLSVVLWELLTGSLPFGDARAASDCSRSLAAMSRQRDAGLSAASLQTLPRDLPEGLRQVLLRCLAPDPDCRPTADELAHQLRLCADESLHALLFPRQGCWQEVASRHPAVALTVPAVIVNVVLSFLSIWYNQEFINDQDDKFQNYFWKSIPYINIPGHVAGLAAGLCLAWPVIARTRAARFGGPSANTMFVPMRCLTLGRNVALVALIGWSAASLVWFTLMSRFDLGLKESVYFASSVLLCGLIAAGLTFFAVTFICVRAMLPCLVRGAREPNVRMELPTSLFLAILVIGPFLAVILFLLTKGSIESSKDMVVSLCVLGVVGILVGLMCSQAIRGDLETLRRITPREPGALRVP